MFPGLPFGLFLLLSGTVSGLAGLYVLRKDYHDWLNMALAVMLFGFTVVQVAQAPIIVLDIRDEFLMNVQRDISLFSGIMGTYSGFIAGIILLRGKTYITRRKVAFTGMTVVVLVLAVAAMIDETVFLKVVGSDFAYAYSAGLVYAVTGVLMPSMFLLGAFLAFGSTWWAVKDSDTVVARKVFRLMLGLGAMILWLGWLLIETALDVRSTADWLLLAPEIILGFLGPFFAYLAFRSGKSGSVGG